MAWLALLLGGLFEVGFATSLRFVDGFRNIPWVVTFLLSVSASMMLLEYAGRTIPMGTAYAVWAGVGAAGGVVLGMVFFGEAVSLARVLLLTGLVGCIIGLRMVE
ncbi:quaternary ammonium compound-resistance protein SugE [Polymorphobacter multimanifer]|uniref:Guanidinium exporter n=1 Tax=Polymorphobacter multimanifer TaxID=1070431 RepID=A0A841LIW7_9SPHN|nr:SMR family transporter [Polymorphobacter multimanifer]MBB6229172.1 quaternary ammonium compound-resistance protein SugE [Polymorphobacter multimanifer]